MLLDVHKSLPNFNEVYLSLFLDCFDFSNSSEWFDSYDCSDCLKLENVPPSNAVNTISLRLRSAAVLSNTPSFTFCKLKLYGAFFLPLSSLIYSVKWFCSSFAENILIKSVLISLLKVRIVINFLKSYVL